MRLLTLFILFICKIHLFLYRQVHIPYVQPAIYDCDCINAKGYVTNLISFKFKGFMRCNNEINSNSTEISQ